MVDITAFSEILKTEPCSGVRDGDIITQALHRRNISGSFLDDWGDGIHHRKK